MQEGDDLAVHGDDVRFAFPQVRIVRRDGTTSEDCGTTGVPVEIDFEIDATGEHLVLIGGAGHETGEFQLDIT